MSIGNYMSNIKFSIKKHVEETYYKDLNATIKVTKRNRKLEEGDFVINVHSSVSCSKLNKVSEANTDSGNAQYDASIHGICSETTSSKDTVPFQVEIDSFNSATAKVKSSQKRNGDVLMVAIDHRQITEFTINAIITQGSEYGNSKHENCFPSIVFCKGNVNEDERPFSSNESKHVTLCDIRTFLVGEHVEQLLKANGYSVVNIQKCPKITALKLFTWDDKETSIPPEIAESVQKDLYEQILKSENKYVQKNDTNDFDGHLETDEKDICNIVKLDLNSFVRDKDLKGYSRNLKFAYLSPESKMLNDVCLLECNRKLFDLHKHNHLQCLYVVPNTLSYQTQLCDINWKILSGTNDSVRSRFLEVAPVCAQNAQKENVLPTVEEFLILREKQAQEAFKMKYGENPMEEQKWKHYIEVLSVAAIKFEFLLTNNLNTLKLDITRDKLDTKGGVFILYNYARLSTLFSNFNKAVGKGTYPKLPSLSDIDFSLLKEKDEWQLVFNYLLDYPSVVAETVCNVSDMSSKHPILTNKICQFLQDLCSDFSSYYNRVHILCEPYPHLIAQMFARLYLMKAIQQIFLNSLSLLGIVPLDEL